MTAGPLAGLGVGCPVLAAPMAGGPTTPALVTAAARAGSLGILAAGYLTARQLGDDLAEVRATGSAYAVNLFAPPPVAVDPEAYRRFRERLLPEAERYAVTLPTEPVEDDDHWHDKVDLLLAEPAPLVSFTFGIPDASVLAALRRAGSLLAQTVTGVAEARAAADAGVDMLVVQASGAGGHSGTLTPDRFPSPRPLPDLVAEVANAVDLPLVAAGGIGDAADVAAALASGAVVAAAGTALLLSPEAGTSAAHRAALLGRERDTTVTHAFTGRPARGLRNRFVDEYDEGSPLGYPALHHLTRPLRRAAVAAGDPELVNLWAGTGYRSATERPAAETLHALAAAL